MHPGETTVFMAVAAAALTLAFLVGYFVHHTTAYQRRKMALAREQVSADLLFVESERARIALELHDDIGNRLAALRLQLELAAGVDPALAEELGDIIAKLRQVLQGLLPCALPARGLQAALEGLDVPCGARLAVSCAVPPLSATTELHLFRIAQEWVSNGCRHAGATEMNLLLSAEKGKLRLRYRDNGKGFDPKEVRTLGGMGLRNVGARVELLGGELYLVTAPGKGVSWLAEIPFA